MSETENGEVSVDNKEQEEDDMFSTTYKTRDFIAQEEEEEESLYGAISSLLHPIFFPDEDNSTSSIFHRSKDSFAKNLPRLRDAATASGFKVLHWARHGSPLRLLLVISVGTITLMTLTGILVFLLFLAAATVNAIIISLFVSLAAAGGFLALFFACVAAIYIGALSVAVFVISSATIAAIITALIVTGWIGFFWILWVIMRKSAGVAKHSVTVTGSALSAYTSAWHGDRHHHHNHNN